MTTWQKVRVTFNDADGNEVSAVMYKSPTRNSAFDGLVTPGIEIHGEFGCEPIRELPTGVGAVVRLTTNPYGDDRDLLVLGPLGEWVGQLSTYPADHLSVENYEILSEGVQL